MRARLPVLICLSAAAVAVLGAASCQPKPDTRTDDRNRAPVGVSSDHHPPPRQSEP